MAQETDLERLHQHNLDMRQMQLQSRLPYDDPVQRSIDEMNMDTINIERDIHEKELEIRQNQPLQEYIHTHPLFSSPRN
jgi:hypothetical protein